MNSIQGLQSFAALEEPLRTSWFCMGLGQEGSVSSGSIDIPAVAFSAPWFLPFLFTEHSQPLLLGWLMKMPLVFFFPCPSAPALLSSVGGSGLGLPK